MRRLRTLVLALTCLAGDLPAATASDAACPRQVGVAFGDTLNSIAAACGVSTYDLMRANPGLTPDSLRAGEFVSVPRAVLPSVQIDIGRPSVRVVPPLVRSPIGGTPPTVILPPEQMPMPSQNILRGFGDQPGQLPLPPGHSPRFP